MRPPMTESESPASQLGKMTRDRHFRTRLIGNDIDTGPILDMFKRMTEFCYGSLPRLREHVLKQTPADQIKDVLMRYAKKSLGGEALDKFEATLDKFLKLMVGAMVIDAGQDTGDE